ncbi:MAG: type IX secretion system outer membrane channel protein PorV [Paludibacteraceae bacterium]|nr:type IX secretion system outer membrane channel protein PorV [Paludibacteraceae bacterium]
MKKTFLSVLAFAMITMPALAQESGSVPSIGTDELLNPIITAFPSLTITPDAKSGGMGGVGVATAPDLNSQHWNPAKYAFMESHGGITASYTPWLRKLVSDIDLAYIAGYYKWDDVQGISASFTYFSLGTVDLTGYDGQSLQKVKPNEWSIDVAYSRKLHEYVSMAVAARFMYSDLNNGHNTSVGNDGNELNPAPMGAADIAIYYRQPFDLPMGTSYLSAGLNISNLGGKISYDKHAHNSFIPANLRLGVQYELPINQYNFLSFAIDINKLMVPSRKSKFAVDGNGDNVSVDDPQYQTKTMDWYNDLNPMKGLFQSFADAPGGAKEEFQEVQWSSGIEYSYDHKFFARVGYSHENKYKGNRQFVTFGAGFHLSIFSLDAAYYLATAPASPIDNTFQVTLGFDLAGIKDLVKK